MMKHKVYSKIISALNDGSLREPFSTIDFKKACPGLGEGTYNAFLYKHKKGNQGNISELFDQVGKNQFIVIRPLRYDF